jgi:BirA family biotin operon repressor/biotin-[acetyl-CoA-carboxylase] ligase
MHIFKLDAIHSTNSFLKEMAVNSALKNYTVVWARDQYSGRGQHDRRWISEPGKNLVFSVFVRHEFLSTAHITYLSHAVSLGVYEFLKGKKVPRLKIKWPNDILSGNKKIAGILIENAFQNSCVKHSVVGIGLNVNQTLFPDSLKNATSLKNVLKKDFNLENLLGELVKSIQKEINACLPQHFKKAKSRYLEALYKNNVPSMFQTDDKVPFMAKIIGVSASGKLQLVLTNEEVKEFEIKEIQFLN